MRNRLAARPNALPRGALLLVSICAGACAPTRGEAPNGPPAAQDISSTRGLVDHTFVSKGDPPLSVELDPALLPIGVTAFDLDKKAHVERHHFAATQEGVVTRLLVLHFEGFLPHAEGRFNYGIPSTLAGGNYRFSPAPIKLGQYEYIHNSWFFDLEANARERPGAEGDRTSALLRRQNLQLGPEVMMTRFVRAVGNDRRHELIIFYFESLAPTGATLADFPEAEPPSTQFDQLAASLTGRARASFEIRD